MEADLAPRTDVPEEELLRARFYGLLSRLLARPASAETLELVRQAEGDETPLGQAFGALSRVARETTPEQAEEEYNALFVGFGAGGELLPYASYYLTGFVYEKPLAELRGDLAALGVAKDAALTEPEDHIFFLFEVMHGLITGAHGAPVGIDSQKQFFDAHIKPWARHFFMDLEGAKSARLYMPVGTLGRLFLDVEIDAFEMAA